MSATQGTGFFTLGVSPDRYILPHPPLEDRKSVV